MNEIEERAWNSAVARMQGDSSYALGYKDGATEQKKIDDANDIQWHSVAEEGLPRHEGTYLVKSKDYNRYHIVPYRMHPDVTPDNCRYSHWAIIGPCSNEMEEE